ncbi:MAG: nucleoside-diphosphate kinase [Endomicrobia bacterium]|nr:nucleoside-diphosphate kinase [Endomicrobiia bacterium]MCL2506415.1 nucleoside-diphosphate kinase [Endomicrobiia bacterium]
MERTLAIIKPDAVCRNFSGDIIKRFNGEGLKLVGLKMLKPARTEMEEFYSVHKEKTFFEPLINFVCSAPVIVMAWEGENAVTRVRSVIGATNSKEAAEGTLRNLFGTDGRRNALHSSDSIENAKREVSFFFKAEEIAEYDYNDWLE